MLNFRERAASNRFLAVTLGGGVLFFACILAASPVLACGWWGDGEVNRDDETAANVTESRLAERNVRNPAKLPGREEGFGIAVPDPGRAVPYLTATYGRPVNRIGGLKTYGFVAVIDLGAYRKSAPLHRAETETVGMRYVNIPIEGDLPERAQVELFKRKIFEEGRHGPVLVYAPTAVLLGSMWASYRMALGSSLRFAVMEAESLGLSVDRGLMFRR